jgi:hypothetical protein
MRGPIDTDVENATEEVLARRKEEYWREGERKVRRKRRKKRKPAER